MKVEKGRYLVGTEKCTEVSHGVTYVYGGNFYCIDVKEVSPSSDYICCVIEDGDQYRWQRLSDFNIIEKLGASK